MRFVPYRADIEEALKGLINKGKVRVNRQDLIRRYEFLLADPFDQLLDPAMRHELGQELEALRAGLPPRSADLDNPLYDTTPSAADSITASPLTAAELHRIFGTSEPTRDMIETNVDRISQLRPKGQITYVVVYDKGLPKEIAFTQDLTE
jgi:hypothetical protein